MSRRVPTSPSSREHLRTQLADLKMPGALEAPADMLRRCDAGELTASDPIAACSALISSSAMPGGCRPPGAVPGSPQ